MSVKVHEVTVENAASIWSWFQDRGGIAIWRSANLSNPGQTWTAPLLTKEGSPTAKQSWEMENEPCRVITDPQEVYVVTPREVKRFHVAVRRGSQGLSFKCTDASSARIKAACAKAGEDSWYEFDYSSQEAVIYVPGEKFRLPEWAAKEIEEKL